MTVRELIIETQLQVKRLGGHRRDSMSEQNIIWRLNTAQDRLIRDSIEPDPNNPNKFLINQASNSLIQKLIKTNTPLPAYRESTVRGYSFLPQNFGYLVNDRSLIVEDCNKAEWASPTEAITQTITILAFGESSLSTGPFYKDIAPTILTNGIPVLTSYNIPGLQSKKEKFELIDYIIDKFNQLSPSLTKPITTYWEKFDSFYYPNCFIVVSDVGNPTIGLVIDGTTSVSIPKTVVRTRIKRFSSGNEVPNRGYKGDFLHDAISHNYYEQPTPDSPVTQLADDKLYFYSSKRFLVSELVLDYIRKPRRISLYLDHTCELDSNVHEKVCSLAAEAILGNVEAANYPLKVQENINRT